MLIVLVAVALGVAGVLIGNSDPSRILDTVTGKRANPVAAPVPPEVASAHSFDPFATDGNEDDTQLPRVFDGNPSTGWETEHYNTPIQDLKPGVGVYVSLTNPTDISRVKLISGSAGWDAEIYVVNGLVGKDLTSWGTPVARTSSIGTGDVNIDLVSWKAEAV